VAVLGLAVLAASALAASGIVKRPHIVWKPIPFGAARRAETAAYDRRHYGVNTWRLRHPRVIVEHFTAGTTFSSAYYTFYSNSPDPGLGELPGTCAHFIIDKDGTIYQLVRLNTVCRHTVGLNYTSIGIEHVGTSDQQILRNPRQLQSSLALTIWLMRQFRITLANVIGHNESLTSPYHRERYAAWRCQTHADWNRRDMNIYRHDLVRLARADGISMAFAAPPAKSKC
jgi:N-acetylmuramoyl-L-alanine amidase-like protein